MRGARPVDAAGYVLEQRPFEVCESPACGYTRERLSLFGVVDREGDVGCLICNGPIRLEQRWVRA